jgi:hypothetical protein
MLQINSKFEFLSPFCIPYKNSILLIHFWYCVPLIQVESKSLLQTKFEKQCCIHTYIHYIQNMHCYNNTKFKVPSRFHFLESNTPNVTHKISEIHHYTPNIWRKNTRNKARCLPKDFLRIYHQSAISWNFWHTYKHNNPIINKALFLVGNLIYALRYEMSCQQ